MKKRKSGKKSKRGGAKRCNKMKDEEAKAKCLKRMKKRGSSKKNKRGGAKRCNKMKGTRKARCLKRLVSKNKKRKSGKKNKRGGRKSKRSKATRFTFKLKMVDGKPMVDSKFGKTKESQELTAENVNWLRCTKVKTYLQSKIEEIREKKAAARKAKVQEERKALKNKALEEAKKKVKPNKKVTEFLGKNNEDDMGDIEDEEDGEKEEKKTDFSDIKDFVSESKKNTSATVKVIKKKPDVLKKMFEDDDEEESEEDNSSNDFFIVQGNHADTLSINTQKIAKSEYQCQAILGMCATNWIYTLAFIVLVAALLTSGYLLNKKSRKAESIEAKTTTIEVAEVVQNTECAELNESSRKLEKTN